MRLPSSVLTLVVALWVIPPAPEARQAPRPSLTSLAPQVEQLMARYMADATPVGVSVGLERDGEVLAQGGWGFADREARKPATPRTVYRLASTSKQFTAALVMRLVERGAVGQDDPVARHWPQMPPKWRGITVRQLLNHTSGVPDFQESGPGQWPKTFPPDKLLGLVGDRSLHFTPSTRYEYSNSNYVMLAMIAEKHYAKPLAQILQDEIARPLGMTGTRLCEDEYGANGQARPYVRRDSGRIDDAPYRSMSHSFGAGGICSVVADMGVWNRALHSGRVVSASSYALMTTPEGAAQAARVGFGLVVRPVAGRTILTHGGLIPGFISINSWVPSDAISVTILANTSSTLQTPALHRDLIRLALGQSVTIVEPIAGPLPNAAALRKYAGNYTIQAPGRPLDIRFWVDGSTLMSQASGQNRAPLRLAGPDTFGTSADWTVRFAFTVVNGVATGFDFEQAGVPLKGIRRK